MRKLIRGLIGALLLAALPLSSEAGVFVSVTIAPPVLPVYEQPPIPGPGYVWTPGYWAWDGSYYWVPGTWVLAPVGLLWTPGYWGWVEGAYVWNAGYWGPTVGFYGGVNYGFGYGGVGFEGGYWRGDQLYYNRSVTNISNTNITNVYNRTVVNNVNVTHTSFNGGPGGVSARPNAAEVAAAHEHHTFPLPAQTEHQTMAAHNNEMRASVNGGRPAVAATQRAAVFTGAGIVAARGAGQSHGAASERMAQSRGGSNFPNERSAQPRGGSNFPSERSAQPRGGSNFPSERATQSRGGSPEASNYAQPRAGGFPQSRESAQPRAGAFPQSREPAQPRGYPQGGGYPQPRAGGYPEGRQYAQPPQPRPEAAQPRGGFPGANVRSAPPPGGGQAPRGNEPQQPQRQRGGDERRGEEHPH